MSCFGVTTGKRILLSATSRHRNSYFSIDLKMMFFVLVTVYFLSINASVSGEKSKLLPHLTPASAAVLSSPVFKPAAADSVSMNLLSSFPEDVEISAYCSELLRMFGQSYVAYVNCLVPAARPIKVCQNCSALYGNLGDIYKNISGEESCKDSLLRSDRLMLVYLLYSNLEDIWEISDCDHCITNDYRGPSNDTLNYQSLLNQTLTCFEKYKQGNVTDLCKNCKNTYKSLNELYSGMEKNHTLCIDIEDEMNVTRKLWSKHFNCSFPREETVPVIAVSSFMLFLPIIFYLSSFLHSEQKKRKLIHPKRAKSYTSLMNIQDKQS